MKLKVLNVFCFLLFVGFGDYVKSQSSQISPKLDFDDAESNENSSVPVIPGVINTRSNEHSGSGSAGVAGTSSKTGPKIHGVRVTVDTGDNPKSKESKESAELSEGGKQTKRVGIHTDITFEITADGVDGANETNSAQQEDASVPIYKGRGSSTNKPRKTIDSKAHWNPNFSSERRNFGSSERRGFSEHGGYYPQYPQYVPKRPSLDDMRHGVGISKDDGWQSHVPIEHTWTTERYIELYRPNAVNGHAVRAPSWKPCYCMSSETDNRRRRDNIHGFDRKRPTSSVILRVDSKLERPFSKK